MPHLVQLIRSWIECLPPAGVRQSLQKCTGDGRLQELRWDGREELHDLESNVDLESGLTPAKLVGASWMPLLLLILAFYEITF